MAVELLLELGIQTANGKRRMSHTNIEWFFPHFCALQMIENWNQSFDLIQISCLQL